MTPDKHDDDFRHLDEVMNTMRSEQPPRAAYEAARQRLLTKLTAAEEKTLMKTLTGTTLQARFGRAAVLAAILVATTFFVLKPLGTHPGAVYASVIKQLKDAVTVAFSAEWYFEGHDEPTYIEMAFREPGLQRTVMTYDGAEIIQINDTVTNEGLILIPAARMYTEMDLTAMPDTERERLGLIRTVTETLESLPNEADQLEVTVREDRTLLGFTSGHKTLWIDRNTETLVRIDNNLGGSRMVMSNFRLDPADLDISKFSTTPPDDYSPVLQAPLQYDVADPGEEDVLTFLLFMAESRVDRVFPATINPLEILTLEEKGLLRVDPDASPEEMEAGGAEFARASQLAVTFVMGMRPDNDWHYIGQGVKINSPDTPIAWWKPEGSDTYRVIWADLTITDEADWDRQATPPA